MLVKQNLNINVGDLKILQYVFVTSSDRCFTLVLYLKIDHCCGNTEKIKSFYERKRAYNLTDNLLNIQYFLDNLYNFQNRET